MERREKRIRRDGMTFCHYVSEREETDIPRADAMYERFSLAAESYALETVARRAIDAYDADENPKKRFRFTAPFCMCRVQVRTDGTVVIVEGAFTVDGQSVFQFSHAWDKTISLALPLRFWKKD